MEKFIDLLNNLPPQVAGTLMAVFMAVIRVIYDDKETKPLRMLLEAMMCGALTFTVTYAITALGLNMNWSMFFGGVIGYLGPQSVRGYIIKILDKKTDNVK